MDSHKQLLIANGQDKTDSVVSCSFEGNKYKIQYSNSSKVYYYNEDNIQILNLQNNIDSQNLIVFANGKQIFEVTEILDFGSFYRVICKSGKEFSFHHTQVKFLHNCLSDENIKCLFNYFKKTAEVYSLVTDNGINILSGLYNKITSVQSDTVLENYLTNGKKCNQLISESTIIYPFGLNQSQKKAVENAFASQISLIQGPPGTGKTQTILNIIANAVLQHKTVAVVSNNNSATMNVVDKLEKKGCSFLTAFLGSLENKQRFITRQCCQYPDMSAWILSSEIKTDLSENIQLLSTELNEMLHRKNRIAEIEQELLELQPEEYYFKEYYDSFDRLPNEPPVGLTSQKILSLWLEYEQHIQQNNKLGSLKKFFIMFHFNRSAVKLFQQTPECVIPYLQNQFYLAKKKELLTEKEMLEKEMTNYSFDEKMADLSQKSMILFRSELAERYNWKNPRRQFTMKDFRGNPGDFTQEYPVVLSTTYSIKGTLSMDFVYDYLIIDEASQVDLATGVLAFSCAKNVVIVGDLKQLPNVLTEKDIQAAEAIWKDQPFDEIYHFTTQSLLSSAIKRWNDVPVVLLREHYRCHPKIIGFCNQKFYQNQLIVMTEDHGEKNVLTMYRSTEGNHARGHINQRQIDIIKKEVLPFLERAGYQDIGIITPYCDQVTALTEQLEAKYEVATVHKFQGREKEAIILTSVDNVIGSFVDDPNMLNVAVSRAVKALVIVTSQDPQNDKTNYGDLARYIEYNNCKIIKSAVFSVFDLLYKDYGQQRHEFFQKHKRISDYESENLLFSVIENIIKKEPFQTIDCAIHVSLTTLIKDYSLLDEEEAAYVRNPLTHTDFLLFNKINKAPVMAIEVDGDSFHKKGSKQSIRDQKKDTIFKKCGLPLLRIRTTESGEQERIENMLINII